MNTEMQKKIDEIMYETNDKISSIVDEIRNVRFSKMDENKKQVKCDKLREQFEQVMLEEENKIELLTKYAWKRGSLSHLEVNCP